MTREIATWLTDNRVGNNSVVDHDDQSSLHCVIVSTDVMSVNEGGHSPRAPKVPGASKVPGAPKICLKILCRYTAHKILSSAINWPQKVICSVDKVIFSVISRTGGGV